MKSHIEQWLEQEQRKVERAIVAAQSLSKHEYRGASCWQIQYQRLSEIPVFASTEFTFEDTELNVEELAKTIVFMAEQVHLYLIPVNEMTVFKKLDSDKIDDFSSLTLKDAELIVKALEQQS